MSLSTLPNIFRQQKRKELEERNRIISFFQRNEKTRIAYQMELSKVGHSKKFALIDYVNNITKLLPDSNLDNYMHLFLYVVVIFAIIAQPASGILVAIGVLINHIMCLLVPLYI